MKQLTEHVPNKEYFIFSIFMAMLAWSIHSESSFMIGLDCFVLGFQSMHILWLWDRGCSQEYIDSLINHCDFLRNYNDDLLKLLEDEEDT